MEDKPKPLLPSWPEIRKQVITSLIVLPFTMLLSVIGQGVLTRTHLLDPATEWVSDRITHVNGDLMAWIVALVVGLALYGFVLLKVWRPRHINPYHRDLQAQIKPVPSLQAELNRADVPDRRWEIGEYSSPPDPPDIVSIVDALSSGMHAQIGSRPLPPDVAAIVEAKRRNLSKTVAARLSANEKWVPLDKAILYLANGSQWGLEQDQNDPHFSVNLSIRLQDALACGDLTARGRKFHVLKGGINDPPLYPLTPLGKVFWEQARVVAYWPLAGTAQNIAGRRVQNVVRKGEYEGMHDVLINQRQLEALWPPRSKDAPQTPGGSSPPARDLSDAELRKIDNGIRRAGEASAEALEYAAKMLRSPASEPPLLPALSKYAKARDARRREMIAKGRDVVVRFRAERPSEPFETWARRQREFLDIQPHLGDEYQKWVISNADRDMSSLADGEFLRELRRLEEEWNLD